MATRARDGKSSRKTSARDLQHQQPGPFDVEHFTAIINPPEAGVLAVGTAKPVPVVQRTARLASATGCA